MLEIIAAVLLLLGNVSGDIDQPKGVRAAADVCIMQLTDATASTTRPLERWELARQ